MLGDQDNQREERAVNLRAIVWNEGNALLEFRYHNYWLSMETPHTVIWKQHSMNIFFLMFLQGQSFESKEQ